MKDLKKRTVFGGLARLCSQAVNFCFRLIFIAILARLLDPKDFGLVAMVTVVTGVYEIFMSGGLSLATIQRQDITDEQISTLFWINMLVGVLLGILCVPTAPILVIFYHQPSLFWVTIVLGIGFVFNAAGVQHYALLQRQLRYVNLAIIDGMSQIASLSVGIGMAIEGFGYWALVGAAIAVPATRTVGAWVSTRWVPSMPRRVAGIGSMLQFGATTALNGVVVYIAYNFEKLLLGRFWGADALGIYGRAYQLITIPTGNLNLAFSDISFSVLSRLQDDPIRFKNYFLKAYSLILSLSIPITIFCALFADDIILVLLGPKWGDAVVVFRLLAPTVLVFGMINPFAWLLLASGLQARSLKIALVIAPLVIGAYFIGLPYGPSGVALAYSTAMTFWLVPHSLWCIHNTMISPKDLLVTVSRPLLSGIVAAVFASGVQLYLGQLEYPIVRLLAGGTMMTGVYFATLLFVMGQKEFYRGLWMALVKPIQSADSHG